MAERWYVVPRAFAVKHLPGGSASAESVEPSARGQAREAVRRVHEELEADVVAVLPRRRASGL